MRTILNGYEFIKTNTKTYLYLYAGAKIDIEMQMDLNKLKFDLTSYKVRATFKQTLKSPAMMIGFKEALDTKVLSPTPSVAGTIDATISDGIAILRLSIGESKKMQTLPNILGVYEVWIHSAIDSQKILSGEYVIKLSAE